MLGIFQSRSGDPERQKLINRYVKLIDSDTITGSALIEAETIRSALGFHQTVEQDVVALRQIKRRIAEWAELPKARKAAEQEQAKYQATAERVKAEIAKLQGELEQARSDMRQPTKHANRLIAEFLHPCFGGAGRTEGVEAVEAQARDKGKLPRSKDETGDLLPTADELVEQTEGLVRTGKEYVKPTNVYGNPEFTGSGSIHVLRNNY